MKSRPSETREPSARPATPAFAMAVLAVLAVLAGACGGDEASGAGADKIADTVLEHDFGVIRHGQIGAADLEVPVPRDDGTAWVPVGFLRDCSCARHEFVLVGPGGEERIATGQPFASFAVGPDEKLRLRLGIHTADKEAIDLEPVTVNGQLVLQTADAPHRRLMFPVRFCYGIDAPIEIRPYGHLDVKDIARSVTYRQTFRLCPDDGPVEFGEPRCLEPDEANPGALRPTDDLEAQVEQAGEETLLHVVLRPGRARPDGPFMMRVDVPTDLQGGYVVRLPISGRVIPDIELSPPQAFAFGQIDLTRPTQQRLVITDHDPSREPGFIVNSIVDRNGVDLAEHFDVTFDPIDSNPRSQRIELAYHGTLDRPFRGTVNLAKAKGNNTLVSIDFYGHVRR